jgi:RNA polymerase sigma-70 factor (ECF subfamily)
LSLEHNTNGLHNNVENPEKQVESYHEQIEMRQNLWKLTSDQRQVILLKYFEGMSNQEVAEVLKKPVGAVKSLQHRGLNALRRLLTSNEN